MQGTFTEFQTLIGNSKTGIYEDLSADGLRFKPS